jgi:hypothetical protein
VLKLQGLKTVEAANQIGMRLWRIAGFLLLTVYPEKENEQNPKRLEVR